MSAKVALLTRNIVIEGADDPPNSLRDQSFGARVLVGRYTDNDGSMYVGKAQISEVQCRCCSDLIKVGFGTICSMSESMFVEPV